jgi:hypothetical protein
MTVVSKFKIYSKISFCSKDYEKIDYHYKNKLTKGYTDRIIQFPVFLSNAKLVFQNLSMNGYQK